MFSKDLSLETVSDLLDFESVSALNSFLDSVGRPDQGLGGATDKLTLKDALILKLVARLLSVGVDPSKAHTYAEAVLASFFSKGWNDFQKLVQDGNQELYCMIEDSQLARIFVRAKDDGREFDVGAIKPVLLPTTRCEINVSRAIRPVIYRTMK
jgi:hypothetical protein